jgi:hypothetical protein
VEVVYSSLTEDRRMAVVGDTLTNRSEDR